MMLQSAQPQYRLSIIILVIRDKTERDLPEQIEGILLP